MKLAIIDNYDSFVYNLRQMVCRAGVEADILRNDAFSPEDLKKYDKLIFSPGPGIPSEAGLMEETIRRYAGKIPMLGVCLGEQAIAEVFGAKLINLERVHHGEQSRMLLKSEDRIFNGLKDGFLAARYHSWAVSSENFPESLEITAMSEDGCIMALKHRQYDIHGVQFHPESVLTPDGQTIISNFINGTEHGII